MSPRRNSKCLVLIKSHFEYFSCIPKFLLNCTRCHDPYDLDPAKLSLDLWDEIIHYPCSFDCKVPVYGIFQMNHFQRSVILDFALWMETCSAFLTEA